MEVLIVIILAGFAVFLLTRPSPACSPAELPPTEEQLAFIGELLAERDSEPGLLEYEPRTRAEAGRFIATLEAARRGTGPLAREAADGD